MDSVGPIDRERSRAGNPTSAWSAKNYTEIGSFVPALGSAVLDLLNPQPGERILDLGCGDGALTLRIAQAGAQVIGVDASADLVTVARGRGLEVHLGSGEKLGFAEEFDAVFSNAALHWMLDAESVAQGVFAALRPGGRFVAEMGGFANIAAIATALRAVMQAHDYVDVDPGQFYPTVEQYEQIATAAGFAEFHGELIPRPTPLATGMVDWLRTFRQGLLDHQGVPPDEQEQIIDETVELLRPALCDFAGNWQADYVRLRFSVIKSTKSLELQ